MTTVVSLSSYDYAAGAWTLRLTGQVSPLTALAERVVLRRLRFQLQLRDEEDMGALGGEAAFSTHPTASRFEWSGPGSDLADLIQIVQEYVQRYLESPGLTPAAGLHQGQIGLAPVGLTRHRLTVSDPTTAVNLSLIQLADLAAVLTQADQAVDLLPEDWASAQPQQGRRQRPWRLPLWTGSVAAVLVAAVLGSQWLGQMAPRVQQAPAPTTATQPPSNDLAPDSVASDEGARDDPAPEADSTTALTVEETPPLAAEAPTGSNAAENVPEESLPAAQAVRPRPPDSPRGAGAAPVNPPATAPGDSSAPLPPPSPARLPPGDSPTPFAGEAPPTARTAPMPEPLTVRPDPLAAAPPAAPDLPAGIAAAESGADALADDDIADGIAAVQTALEQRWQPIPGLASPLRYHLTLGPMGEVLAWEPLTAPARQYLAQGLLPQVGEVLPNVRLPETSLLVVDLWPSGAVGVALGVAAQP